RRGAKKRIADARGIVLAGNAHGDAVGTGLGDFRLGETEFVDAAADNIEGGVGGFTNTLGETCLVRLKHEVARGKLGSDITDRIEGGVSAKDPGHGTDGDIEVPLLIQG